MPYLLFSGDFQENSVGFVSANPHSPLRANVFSCRRIGGSTYSKPDKFIACGRAHIKF
jgi:hypothetical protein